MGNKRERKERHFAAKKAVVHCQKCGGEMVVQFKTKIPKYCDNCKNTTWKTIGYEDSQFGRVMVQEKNGRIRKILVE